MSFKFFLARSYQPIESRATRRICGIIGTINLINGLNLIVATHREYVGQINGQVIWRLAGYDIIPYMSATHFLSVNQVRLMKLFKTCS